MSVYLLLWLGLLAVFVFLETVTVSLVSIWFALGALAAGIAEMLGASILWQTMCFLVISGAALASLRPLVRRYLQPKIVPTNVDSIAGTLGTVTQAIDNLQAQGQVKLGSMTWSARSQDGSPIPAGTTVKAERIEGVKVFVSAVQDPEKVSNH